MQVKHNAQQFFITNNSTLVKVSAHMQAKHNSSLLLIIQLCSNISTYVGKTQFTMPPNAALVGCVKRIELEIFLSQCILCSALRRSERAIRLKNRKYMKVGTGIIVSQTECCVIMRVMGRAPHQHLISKTSPLLTRKSSAKIVLSIY